jgi:hypothetical protein
MQTLAGTDRSSGKGFCSFTSGVSGVHEQLIESCFRNEETLAQANGRNASVLGMRIASAALLPSTPTCSLRKIAFWILALRPPERVTAQATLPKISGDHQVRSGCLFTLTARVVFRVVFCRQRSGSLYAGKNRMDFLPGKKSWLMDVANLFQPRSKHDHDIA